MDSKHCPKLYNPEQNEESKFNSDYIAACQRFYNLQLKF